MGDGETAVDSRWRDASGRGPDGNASHGKTAFWRFTAHSHRACRSACIRCDIVGDPASPSDATWNGLRRQWILSLKYLGIGESFLNAHLGCFSRHGVLDTCAARILLWSFVEPKRSELQTLDWCGSCPSLCRCTAFLRCGVQGAAPILRSLVGPRFEPGAVTSRAVVRSRRAYDVRSRTSSRPVLNGALPMAQ